MHACCALRRTGRALRRDWRDDIALEVRLGQNEIGIVDGIAQPRQWPVGEGRQQADAASGERTQSRNPTDQQVPLTISRPPPPDDDCAGHPPTAAAQRPRRALASPVPGADPGVARPPASAYPDSDSSPPPHAQSACSRGRPDHRTRSSSGRCRECLWLTRTWSFGCTGRFAKGAILALCLGSITPSGSRLLAYL